MGKNSYNTLNELQYTYLFLIYSCPPSTSLLSLREETSDHMLSTCGAYSDLREGLNPEAVLEDRATFLRGAIKRRKELELKLKTTVVIQ